MGKTDSKIVINKLCHTRVGEWSELSVELTAPHLHWNKKKLWFRFPETFSTYFTDNYDPFLAALLPIAMKTKSDIVIKGSVSKRLIANIRQIMKILSRWYVNMVPVEIEAKALQSAKYSSKAVGSFFTAGVDSFYTVLKNLKLYQNEARITHLLYVQGLDIKITNQELFNTVKDEITSAATELNVEPIFIKTNLREITDRYVRWGEEQHGAAIASTALGLIKFLKTVYIPSSCPYTELYPWGSHPLIDPLWSNGNIQFIHDGNEANRSQKILWQLSGSETAMKYLRVCWKNPDNHYNCGICGKCIRTKINLKIAGVLHKCKTLNNSIDQDLYKKILLNSYVERRNLVENIELVEDNNQELKEKLNNIQYSITKERNKLIFKLRVLAKKIIYHSYIKRKNRFSVNFKKLFYKYF